MARYFRARLGSPLNVLAALSVSVSLLLIGAQHSAPAANAALHKPFCTLTPQLCTETLNPWNYQGQYQGHDEPSVLFYSNKPGSGNTNLYHVTLPKEPTSLPRQDGTGATWNFQLHPAFWFGMAMCDNQSYPNPGATCAPDSDNNIYTSTDPASPNYIGKAPGQAFMEMQFYPPGWSQWPPGISCSATQWCAALNIDSYAYNPNTGALNNSSCLDSAGVEYVNFAFITKSGKSQAPADPLDQTLASFTPDANQDLFMSPGDQITVNMHDTPSGFVVAINDATTGQGGSMMASAANGFGHPVFQPSAGTCTDQPYSFHPLYATSSPSTRVLWAAHSYNVAYSDEIGHFEYCNAADNNLNCSSAGAGESSGLDDDDGYCLTSPVGTSSNNITGCISSDIDFDGSPYGHNWAGSSSNAATDLALHGTPIMFSSPTFNGSNYSQVAFENDLPRIEFGTCNRTTGSGCTGLPPGASFYPFYSAVSVHNQCMWAEGDANLPNVLNNFGGSAPSEYGGLLNLDYSSGSSVVYRYNDYRNVLSNNPCPAPGQ